MRCEYVKFIKDPVAVFFEKIQFDFQVSIFFLFFKMKKQSLRVTK